MIKKFQWLDAALRRAQQAAHALILARCARRPALESGHERFDPGACAARCSDFGLPAATNGACR